MVPHIHSRLCGSLAGRLMLVPASQLNQPEADLEGSVR
eukprot:CAMPEP_0185440530 /NCGR_PEP_ID=MMETSP1365-20130426/40275_1 /TAXON_ID=38817 /ORGANISM="Gephyrocapsa oceanica, Strain RCC1303" /LENGTH=37 /DNA_ID= /DNA_START= /DNA_END= /DNA_ORIENTATION=